MSETTLLVLWSTSAVVFLVLPLTVVLRARSDMPQWELGSVAVALVANLPGLFTLAVFTWVFILGGGEPDPEQMGWWQRVYGPLFVATPIALGFSVTAAALPPYPPRHWGSFLCRLAGCASAGFAWHVVLNYVPQA
jgi:hypothetical protein